MTEPVTATATETSLDAHGKLVTIRINELHTLICVFGNKSEKERHRAKNDYLLCMYVYA
jgi:hypothetical protein